MEKKKENFNYVYVSDTPVAFKEILLEPWDYVSDDFSKREFDRIILPWVWDLVDKGKVVNFVDVCPCFGNTTMATLYGMSSKQIRENWKDSTTCQTIDGVRRFPAHTTGIDYSVSALAYGNACGLYDDVVAVDLNNLSKDKEMEIHEVLSRADVMVACAALVYLDLEAMEKVLRAFCDSENDGYVLVNFLNIFTVEKADASKRLILKYLDFVGSAVARHRKTTPMERVANPDEEWILVEYWILKRPTKNSSHA